MLLRYARRVIGDFHVIAHHRNRGPSRVIEVADREGERWFVKRLRFERQFWGEVQAYKYWTANLSDRVPPLRHIDTDHRILILGALPGRAADTADAATLYEAGTLLRRFHDSVDAGNIDATVWDRIHDRADFELARCRRFGEAVDETLVRRSVQHLRQLPQLAEVPCHGDFLPHNWLIDEHGTVRVIDFAEAGMNAAAADFTRLVFGPAWDRRDLMESFLDGYGRELDDAERRFVECYLAVTATTAVGWGRQFGRDSVRDRGREVLHRLADGYTFVPRRSPVRRSLSRLRRAAGAYAPIR